MRKKDEILKQIGENEKRRKEAENKLDEINKILYDLKMEYDEVTGESFNGKFFKEDMRDYVTYIHCKSYQRDVLYGMKIYFEYDGLDFNNPNIVRLERHGKLAMRTNNIKETEISEEEFSTAYEMAKNVISKMMD